MDKETLSKYGWVVIVIIIIVLLLGFAAPLGNFVADSFTATYKALDAENPFRNTNETLDDILE